jgi:hypothetical protein
VWCLKTLKQSLLDHGNFPLTWVWAAFAVPKDRYKTERKDTEKIFLNKALPQPPESEVWLSPLPNGKGGNGETLSLEGGKCGE